MGTLSEPNGMRWDQETSGCHEKSGFHKMEKVHLMTIWKINTNKNQ